MKRKLITARLKNPSGVALIEFAITIPVLLLLLVILFECGRLFHFYLRFTEVAWEGARFFSSLQDPVKGCISPETTNLVYTEPGYYNSLNSEAKMLFIFHSTIQDRVLNLFNYNSESWPIESDGLIPGGSDPKSLKEVPFFSRKPTISTQYVDPEGEPPCLLPSGSPADAGELNNTVTVCLEATYIGFFFRVPVRVCSTSHLLENNETLRLPEIPAYEYAF